MKINLDSNDWTLIFCAMSIFFSGISIGATLGRSIEKTRLCKLIDEKQIKRESCER